MKMKPIKFVSKTAQGIGVVLSEKNGECIVGVAIMQKGDINTHKDKGGLFMFKKSEIHDLGFMDMAALGLAHGSKLAGLIG